MRSRKRGSGTGGASGARRNAQVRYNLGLVLLQLGQTAKAVPELEEAVKLNPGDRAAIELLRQARSSLPTQ